MAFKRASFLIPTILVGLAWPVPAYAGHGGKGTDPDNQNQYIEAPDSLTTYGSDAMNHGKAQLERSDITTYWGTNDIRVYDYNYGDTAWAGKADCLDLNWLGQSCDVIRVRFNEHSMVGLGQGSWKSLGCHEFGHTGDIGHRPASGDTDKNSCMRDDDIWPQNFDSHDLEAINSSTN